GKSTAADAVARQLEAQGLAVAILSLDDLYLAHERRLALARQIHPLFATRGVPGTHDVELGIAVVDRLRAGAPTPLPPSDKATDTSLPPSAWPASAAKVDVVLFEGWCVGARPQRDEDLAHPVNRLEAEEDEGAVWRRAVNNALAGPYQALFAR